MNTRVNAKPFGHTEGINAWSFKFVLCILLMCLASTVYGNMGAGNFESADSNDNWAEGWEGSPVFTPASTLGVTMGEGSLGVAWVGKFWALTWNAPAVPTIEDGTKFKFDVTAFGSDFADWAKVADKIALNSDGVSGWKEYDNQATAIDRTNGDPANLDFGSWSGTVERTYMLDISDYDLTGATFFQVNISLQANPDGVGAGKVYIDNAWLGKPLPKLHTDGNKIKDPNGHVVVLRGLSTIDIGMLERTYGGVMNFIDRVTNKNDANGTSPGWYTKVIRYSVCPNDSSVTDSPLVFNPYNADDPNNEEVYNLLKQAADYGAENGVYTIINWHYATTTSSKVAETTAFWEYMAPRFANDNNVLFELFNEPTDKLGEDEVASWERVKSNMQIWVDIVRESAPDNLILVAGADWGHVLEPAVANPIEDDNIVYATHVYPNTWTDSEAYTWITRHIDAISALYPVLVTAWGYSSTDVNDCNWGCYSTKDDYGQPLIDYLEDKGIGSLANCASYNWNPSMFDPNWQLKCEEENMGCFVKDWFYEKRNAERYAVMTTNKCKVTAAKVAADGSQGDNDSMTASGTFSNIALDFDQITEIDVNITSADGNQAYHEVVECNSTWIKKGKFGYKHKIPKGEEGAITALSIDPVKRTYSLKLQKVDLTGLSCPFEIEFTTDYYILSGSVTETVVNGASKLIPTRLMRLYDDTLIVTKGSAKDSSKEESDSLSLKGDIAVADMDLDANEPNLAAEEVVLTWGSNTFTIPADANFCKTAKKGHSYKYSKAPADEGGLVTGTIDLDKCTYTISIKGFDLEEYEDESGVVPFGINFATPDSEFDETADVNLVTKRSY